jgi:phosphoribosyl-ATP pyrophosphohydrolase
MNIDDLNKIIASRITSGKDGSYTVKLFNDGLDRIAQKVGEEGVEVVIAAKNNDEAAFVGEVADLYYHTLVLLAKKEVSLQKVWRELERRNASTND